MKKSSFIALVLGTISGVLFALGMCMATLPEWNAFKPGVIFGCVGIALGFTTIIIWRRLENKEPIHLNAKTIPVVIISIIGALALGVGMCFSMVWGQMIIGIIVGIIGIVILLSLIPITKGIR